jgi:hypothetical protein
MKPGAPRPVSARRASASTATLRFRAPLANGGRRVLRYVARCVSPGHPTAVATRTGSPITVGGLHRGIRYRCTLRAVNALGIGAASRALTV